MLFVHDSTMSCSIPLLSRYSRRAFPALDPVGQLLDHIDLILLLRVVKDAVRRKLREVEERTPSSLFQGLTAHRDCERNGVASYWFIGS